MFASNAYEADITWPPQHHSHSTPQARRDYRSDWDRRLPYERPQATRRGPTPYDQNMVAGVRFGKSSIIRALTPCKYELMAGSSSTLHMLVLVALSSACCTRASHRATPVFMIPKVTPSVYKCNGWDGRNCLISRRPEASFCSITSCKWPWS